MNKIFVPISVGELFDKITILEIKKEKILDTNKLKNIITELKELESTAADLNFYKEPINKKLQYFISELKKVNYLLWDIEEKKRFKESKKIFDNEFIQLARSVYLLNDKRAGLKKEINVLTNSKIIEEKSY